MNPTNNFSTLHKEQKSVNNNFGNKTNLEIKLKSFNFKIQIKDQLKSDNKLQNQKQTHKQTFLYPSTWLMCQKYPVCKPLTSENIYESY